MALGKRGFNQAYFILAFASAFSFYYIYMNFEIVWDANNPKEAEECPVQMGMAGPSFGGKTKIANTHRLKNTIFLHAWWSDQHSL